MCVYAVMFWVGRQRKPGHASRVTRSVPSVHLRCASGRQSERSCNISRINGRCRLGRFILICSVTRNKGPDHSQPASYTSNPELFNETSRTIFYCISDPILIPRCIPNLRLRCSTPRTYIYTPLQILPMPLGTVICRNQSDL